MSPSDDILVDDELFRRLLGARSDDDAPSTRGLFVGPEDKKLFLAGDCLIVVIFAPKPPELAALVEVLVLVEGLVARFGLLSPLTWSPAEDFN